MDDEQVLQRLRTVVGSAAEAIAAARSRIDDLNVYPVPDGDTGTNLSLTLEAVRDRVDALAPAPAAELAAAVAEAALLGARGNSGIILSQILRGAAGRLAGASRLDGATLALALRAGSDAADAGVRRPVEGTMLTVVRELAEEAEARREDALPELLRRVVVRGDAAVQRTPELLATLRDAGVVDAGGAGLVEIVRGAARALGAVEAPDAASGRRTPVAALISGHDAPSRFRFCTNLLVRGAGLDRGRLEGELAPLGDSLVVVGDAALLKVHLHTDEPDRAVERAAAMGTVDGLDVADMHAQIAQRTERLGADARQRPATAPTGAQRTTDVVCVVAGAGNAELARSRGARGIVEGGRSMNPSTGELLGAIEACAAEGVVVLPNDPNVVAAAAAAVAAAERPALLVETRSIPAGLAALEAYDPAGPLEAVARAMRDAAEAVVTAEVTSAVRDATVDGIAVRRGSFLALVEGRAVAADDEPAAVLERLAEHLPLDDGGSVAALVGDADGERFRPALQRLGARRAVDLDVRDGGQPHASLLLSAHRPVRLDAASTAIVYDSTADLPEGPAAHESWRMVPLTVQFGEVALRDHVDLGAEEFYRRLRASQTLPTTSQPTPAAFAAVYDELLADHDHVVSLHLSGRLSGTVESARLAAAPYGRRVTVIDTGGVSVLLALAVVEVQRLLDAGTTRAALCRFVDRFRAEAHCVFSLETLEFLVRGGRIGRARALVGGLLAVRPILAVEDGVVTPVRRVRGARRALEALVEELDRRVPPPRPVRVIVAHGAAPEAGRALEAAVRRARPDAELLPMGTIGAVVGTHGGPGVVGLAAAPRDLPA